MSEVVCTDDRGRLHPAAAWVCRAPDSGSRKVLEISAQICRSMRCGPKPTCSGVADDAALKRPVQFVGSLCLAAAEGSPKSPKNYSTSAASTADAPRSIHLPPTVCPARELMP